MKLVCQTDGPFDFWSVTWLVPSSILQPRSYHINELMTSYRWCIIKNSEKLYFSTLELINYLKEISFFFAPQLQLSWTPSFRDRTSPQHGQHWLDLVMTLWGKSLCFSLFHDWKPAKARPRAVALTRSFWHQRRRLKRCGRIEKVHIIA